MDTDQATAQAVDLQCGDFPFKPIEQCGSVADAHAESGYVQQSREEMEVLFTLWADLLRQSASRRQGNGGTRNKPDRE